MIEVRHAELGLQGLINSRIVNASDVSRAGAGTGAVTLYINPTPNLAGVFDKSSNNYSSDEVGTWNFAVHLDRELFFKNQMSNLDVALAETDPNLYAAMYNAASTASSQQMDLAIVMGQALGLFTTGGDTVKKIVAADFDSPTTVEIKNFRVELKKAIKEFIQQVSDKRKIGLTRRDLVMVVSPTVMNFMVEAFGMYPTIFGQTVMKEGLVSVYLGVEVRECLVLGQNISANVVSKLAYNFSGFDMALLINQDAFYSVVFNFQPLTAYNQTQTMGNLYQGYIRSAMIQKQGGRWAYTDKDNSNPWFKCVQRFKLSTS